MDNVVKKAIIRNNIFPLYFKFYFRIDSIFLYGAFKIV